MIGLDTNLIVRYLAQDDPVQSPRASAVVERMLSEQDPGFVSIVAMVETAWVLKRAYKLSDRKVASAVERILQSDVLVVEDEQEVFSAMIALKEGRGSFSDALVAALGARAGCSRTLTFDRKSLRLAGFELVA
jgi:predicted nucleic-acid-binding protein